MTWPEQDLPCLDDQCQQIAHSSTNSTVIMNEGCTSVISMQRFSTFSRLLKVTSLVFRFIGLTRKREENYDKKAAIYLIKNSQQQVFTTELNYLRDPTEKLAPNRVQALDIFLDEEGLIHSGGRLDKSSQFNYEVKNPLLLGKKHHLTRLIILDCHLSVLILE